MRLPLPLVESILQQLLNEAPSVAYAEAVSATVSGDPFLVPHTLGVVPEWVEGVASVGGRVWFTEDDRRSWSEQFVRLRADAGGVRVRVRVESLQKSTGVSSALATPWYRERYTG